MKRVLMLLALAVMTGFTAVSGSVRAAGLTGSDIIARMDSLGAMADLSAHLDMKTTQKSGTKNFYKMSMVMKATPDGGRKMLIRMLGPATIRGTTILSISRPGAPDETWLYLPAIGKPRRISAGERGGSFMGSDFSYEDMGLLKTEDYRYTLVRTEVVDGEEVYVVDSVPASESTKSTTGYASKTWWVRKDTFTRARAESKSASGKVVKVLRSWNLVQLAPNAWFTTFMEMQNLRSGSSTLLTFSEMKANTGIPDTLFSVEQLGK